jgi:hypothetical protein
MRLSRKMELSARGYHDFMAFKGVWGYHKRVELGYEAFNET